MTNEKILEYVEKKLAKIKRNKEMYVSLLLEQHSAHDKNIYQEEYLKNLYAYDELLDIKTFIKTGVNMDHGLEEKE